MVIYLVIMPFYVSAGLLTREKNMKIITDVAEIVTRETVSWIAEGTSSLGHEFEQILEYSLAITNFLDFFINLKVNSV